MAWGDRSSEDQPGEDQLDRVLTVATDPGESLLPGCDTHQRDQTLHLIGDRGETIDTAQAGAEGPDRRRDRLRNAHNQVQARLGET
jgi:hypothetical protein